MKTCKVCKLEKDYSEFHRHKSTADLLRAECKSCRNEENKKAYEHKMATRIKPVDKRSLRIKKSKKETLEIQKIYANNRYNTDIPYRLARVLRARVRSALKNEYKTSSAVTSLGCSVDFLKTYLESLFQPEMNWENHSKEGWHIDHIVPISSAKNSEEMFKLCHYSNLQPLWAKENLSKGKKVA